MFVASDKYLAVADGGRSKGAFAEFIFGDKIEVWPRLYDVHDAIVVEQVDEPVCGNEGGVVFAETLLPENLASGRIEAMRDTGIRNDQEVIAFDNRRGHVS